MDGYGTPRAGGLKGKLESVASRITAPQGGGRHRVFAVDSRMSLNSEGISCAGSRTSEVSMKLYA